MYKKTTQTAFAAMSLLAERYDGGLTRVSANEIAERRDLQLPFLSKVLTVLAQAGLVDGTRGPGGGFTLARRPEQISLYDVFVLFERQAEDAACPFGGGICGVGENCPLHERFERVQSEITSILHDTHFGAYQR